MSYDYEMERTIDCNEVDDPEEEYEKIRRNWRWTIIKEDVVSPKVWRKGGRTLTRAVKRKKCRVEEYQEDETTGILEFWEGERRRSILTINLINTEENGEQRREETNTDGEGSRSDGETSRELSQS